LIYETGKATILHMTTRHSECSTFCEAAISGGHRTFYSVLLEEDTKG